MTAEDEGFVRRIVDSPGDDTPRLVYADWLDERGDPRGAYLRAEREAYHTGNASELRAFAVGLDPVWVARVSLPPYGVCVARHEVLESGPNLTREQLAATENRLGVTLPDDYRGFLLNYNGGRIELGGFDTPDGPFGVLTHSFSPMERVVRCASASEDGETRDPIERLWFSQFVLVGHNPDMIYGVLLAVDGPRPGHVLLYDYSSDWTLEYTQPSAVTSSSFAEYLSTIT